MAEIKFGTDGWRAVIAEDFTFENVKIVAQAIADYIGGKGHPSRSLGTRGARVKDRMIAIGYDTRFLSEKFAETIACVIAGNGIWAILADRPAPSPSVSFAIKERALVGGVVVTASHNPARYNGIKFKSHYGGSADPETTSAIESYLGKNKVKFMPIEDAKSKGLICSENIITSHLDFVKRYVDIRLVKRSRLKVLVDSMYGSGDGYISGLLDGGSSRVETIHGGYNPGFGGINPEPIMPNLKELAERVKSDKFDIGLATDGDADRCGVAIPNGRLLTGHKAMALLLLHMLEDKNAKGDVVQTICGTVLIDKICRKYNLKVHETPVGFKYISKIMHEEDVLIGGEETGGIAFKDYIPERDGILAGLLMLEMMAMRKKGIEDILKEVDRAYGRYEYRRLDVKYPDDKKARLMKSLKRNPPEKVLDVRIVKIKDTDGYKFMCEDASWLMLRLSGTEPILRIYAEASSEKRALKILEFGKRLAYNV